MLEFYSVRIAKNESAMTSSYALHARSCRAVLPITTAIVLALAGCATPPVGGPGTPPSSPAAQPPAPPPPQPVAPPLPRNVEPPAPKMNLSGFPLPYRQGYADGCASASGAERKDASRFSSDMNYRTGWTDGRALCKPK
jgi:hypothetical protein